MSLDYIFLLVYTNAGYGERSMKEKCARIHITLQPRLLARIDAAAKKERLSRSAWIAKAALSHIKSTKGTI